jgi:polynucleotide 5'-kinase involved in rRNA processing
VNGETYSSLRERVVGEHGVVMIIGAADSGKTTMARFLLADAVAAGRSVAYVDADIAANTTGPPACVGLRWVAGEYELQTLDRADDLRFVGAVQPQGVVLPHVVAAADLVNRAKAKADFIVLDTTGVVSGVVGQTLKYHLAELVEPALVLAMQRGSELEPTIGMLRRFLGTRVAKVTPEVAEPPLSPLERRDARRKAFREARGEPLQHWSVSSQVFAPTLPDGFDTSRLDHMLVGVQDGAGRCLGLGVLEVTDGTDGTDGTISVATRYGEAMEGLRLGSVRIDPETYAISPVRLRQLIFGV